MATTREGVAKLTAFFAGPQKMERGAPGSMAVNPVTGMPVEGSQIQEKPERPVVVGQGEIAVDPKTGTTLATGQPKAAAPKSLQMKSVLVDGKPTEASYNPVDGSWQVGGAPIDASRVKPIPPASTHVTIGGEGGLTPDGLALAATAYRLTRQLPSRNASQNAAIMNEAAKQATALGQTPAAVIQKQYAQKSDASALTKMTTMASAAEAFETKANAQAGLVAELSKKVDRTKWPIANGIIVNGQAALGSTDAHLFGNALLTFTTEYAKIMEGATGSAAGSSDAARKDAARLISTALNKGTLDKTIQQMQWEMRQTILGYDTVIGHINERLSGTTPAATPATGAGPSIGERRMFNGKLGEWDGKGWKAVP